MDQKWRIRAAIIGHMPLLAKQMGTQFFEEKLSDLCMDWLGDTVGPSRRHFEMLSRVLVYSASHRSRGRQVHSIREAATQNLERLAEVFGADWAGAHILPKIVQLSTNNSYLYRMTALKALTVRTVPVFEQWFGQGARYTRCYLRYISDMVVCYPSTAAEQPHGVRAGGQANAACDGAAQR